jgi:hypothetical protein
VEWQCVREWEGYEVVIPLNRYVQSLNLRLTHDTVAPNISHHTDTGPYSSSEKSTGRFSNTAARNALVSAV